MSCVVVNHRGVQYV